MPDQATTSSPGGASTGNRATFFDDGQALFAAMADAIRAARERVWVETFLFTPDETGREALDLLADAARRGCDVILLFDQLGSTVANLGFYRSVTEAGGRVAIFNPLPPWRRYGRRLGDLLRYRDHRKTLIADDVGFCGGHNLSSAYMGPPSDEFYDVSVKLEGPCVRDLASIFLDSFTLATRESRPLPAAPPAIPGGVRVAVHAQDLRRGERGLVRAYTEAVEEARDAVTLIMAYFVPDALLCRPLIEAAERGVRVRLLTAGATDFVFMRWASQYTFDGLLKAGVTIHQLQKSMLHAKCMTVDGERCLVGSFDINRFERRNTAEVAATLWDPHLAARIDAAYEECMPHSEEATLEERKRRWFYTRAVEWLSYKALGI